MFAKSCGQNFWTPSLVSLYFFSLYFMQGGHRVRGSSYSTGEFLVMYLYCCEVRTAMKVMLALTFKTKSSIENT